MAGGMGGSGGGKQGLGMPGPRVPGQPAGGLMGQGGRPSFMNGPVPKQPRPTFMQPRSGSTGFSGRGTRPNPMQDPKRGRFGGGTSSYGL